VDRGRPKHRADARCPALRAPVSPFVLVWRAPHLFVLVRCPLCRCDVGIRWATAVLRLSPMRREGVHCHLARNYRPPPLLLGREGQNASGCESVNPGLGGSDTVMSQPPLPQGIGAPPSCAGIAFVSVSCPVPLQLLVTVPMARFTEIAVPKHWRMADLFSLRPLSRVAKGGSMVICLPASPRPQPPLGGPGFFDRTGGQHRGCELTSAGDVVSRRGWGRPPPYDATSRAPATLLALGHMVRNGLVVLGPSDGAGHLVMARSSSAMRCSTLSGALLALPLCCLREATAGLATNR
jgi:hypothetical protein